MPLSFLKKLYSYTNIGSAYILELEQIHEREALTLTRFSGHKKTYFPLSEGSKNFKITFLLFTELDCIKNITILKIIPDHFKPVLRENTILTHLSFLHLLNLLVLHHLLVLLHLLYFVCLLHCLLLHRHTVNYPKYPFFPVIKRGIVPIFTE